MHEKFEINNIVKPAYCVGKLDQNIIDLLGLNLKESKILISQDKIRYTLKHKDKFKSYNDYKKHIELTPEIIANPDYVALHPNGQSIEYIKRIDDIVLIAVRIKATGNLWIKSIFPITDAKLNIYLRSGSTVQLKY